MGHALAALAWLCLTLSALSLVVPAAASSQGLAPDASSFTLALTADRLSAERNETIGFALYLNVTGGGQLQLARVNVTVQPDLEIDVAALGMPPDCFVTTANTTFVEWQCTSLRVGRSYGWSIPASVAANATVGRYRTATAAALEIGGGPATPRVSRVDVWIVIGVLAVSVDSNPSTSVFQGDLALFGISVTNFMDANDTGNETRLTAHNVTLTLEPSPYLQINASTPLVYRNYTLTPRSSVIVNISAIVSEGAPIGIQVWINATLVYEDATNRSIGPRLARGILTVAAPPPFQSNFTNVLVIVAFGILTIVVAIALSAGLGERRIVIDEVFLMHRSGILIQHMSEGPDLRKDDDLVASMFVAIQDFVRDSFDAKATLDEMSFGGRKAAVLRGEHIILAALTSKGNPRYLFPQMKAVERALERAHGPALVDWDGRLTSLDQVGPILQSFLRGGFRRGGLRRVRGWTNA